MMVKSSGVLNIIWEESWGNIQNERNIIIHQLIKRGWYVEN
jgi:hypothetical protein